MTDRAVQREGNCLQAFVAPVLIIIGLLLGLADLGARWLEPGTDPPTHSNVHPPRYADSELAAVFQRHDAVFVGRVIGFNERYNPGLLGELSTTSKVKEAPDGSLVWPPWEDVLPGVVFRVEIAWKGVRQTEVAMPVGFMNSDDTCWGRHFDVGSSYLVYAAQYPPYTDPSEQYLRTSQCDPTTLFPYTYDPTHQRVYDLPDGTPDLNLDIVGDGYFPSEPANLLRFQPPVVLIVAGVLILGGVLIVLLPWIMHEKNGRRRLRASS